MAAQYGEGATHSRNEAVERLVGLVITPDGIALAERPPLQLVLLGDLSPRNWEGLVRFQADEFDGFLLDVPPGLDVKAYTAVVVWCEAFSVTCA